MQFVDNDTFKLIATCSSIVVYVYIMHFKTHYLFLCFSDQ